MDGVIIDGTENEPASASTKSKRRRKAKQASKAKREAVGDNGYLPVDSSSAELLPDVVHAGVVNQQRPSTASVVNTKKSKSRSGNKISLVLDESTQRLLSPLKNDKCQHEEKIAKAVENRELLLQEKSEKVRQQSKKVEDAKHQKAAAIKQIKENMTDRMRRAEEKRNQQITTIKTRARDEATKVDEVNFINNWKSQNRILDVLEKDQKIVSRQQVMEEERARKTEEHKAREEAAQQNRSRVEQDRVTKISEMEERKRIKMTNAEQLLSHRLQQVRVKARDREKKLSAIEAAQQANLESLKERIQKKTEISTRLHEERIELKRLRAQYLRSPRPGSADSASFYEYSTPNRCRSHTGDNSPRGGDNFRNKIEAQVEIEDISARYNRLGNKLRSKLTRESSPVEKADRRSKMESGDVSQAQELLDRLKSVNGWSSWTSQITSSLDACLERLMRHTAYLARTKEKSKNSEVPVGFLQIVELSVRLITSSVHGEPEASVPEKPLCSIYNLLSSVLSCGTFASLMRGDVFVGVIEQALYFSEQLFFGNKSGKTVPDKVFDACYGSLERILWHFNHLCSSTVSNLDCDRLSDFVKYFMTCGLVQMIGRYHTRQLEDYCLIRVRRSFQFTTWVSRILSARKVTSDRDPDHFNATGVCSELNMYRDILRAAPVFGSVTLLYDLLRLGRSQPRCTESCTSQLPEDSYRVAVDIVRMLSFVGNADLASLQSAFRDLTLSIQFRHICSFLIDHCLTFRQQRSYLLHEVVLLIGQFAFLSPGHQDILHAGHPPTLLQQLALFPVDYFTCGALQDVLLPTLVICCFENRKNCAVLSGELDVNHLTLYIKDREMNPWPHPDLGRLIKLAKDTTPFFVDVFREHSAEDFERYRFENRFPKNLWNAAAQFFYASVPKKDPEVPLPIVEDNELKYFFEEMSAMLSDVKKTAV